MKTGSLHRITETYYIRDRSCNFTSHSLNGIVQTVCQRRPSIPMGIGKFQPPHIINTPEPIDKKSAQLITSASGPPIPNLVEIHLLGTSGQMGKIQQKLFLFIYLDLFSLISLQVRPVDGFLRAIAQNF